MRVTTDRISFGPGAVIQLDPEHCEWGPLLCIVDEVCSWGVVCYAMIAEKSGDPPAQMFLRAKHEQYVVLGTAEWMMMGVESDEPPIDPT